VWRSMEARWSDASESRVILARGSIAIITSSCYRTLSGELFTMVGVMPPDFEFSSSDIDMWTPLRLTPASTTNVQVLGRMKEGLPVGQIQSAMRIVAGQLVERDPQNKAGLEIVVSPWRDTVQRQYELTLVFILVAVGLVLLIACADVGSLLLSRAVQRQKEIAIRASLGAGFWRVMQQVLAESLVLAVLGSIAGMGIAHYALRFLSQQMTALPIAIPHLQRVALNERVLLFNTGLCLLLACAFSIAPILLASKTDLQLALRSGPAAGGSKRSARMFSILIASEASLRFFAAGGIRPHDPKPGQTTAGRPRIPSRRCTHHARSHRHPHATASDRPIRY
jgi:putative ABC transport system permease protein